MSGTAYGAIILHVAPDAASGGPIGLVRSGDRIRLSVVRRTIELLVDETAWPSSSEATTVLARRMVVCAVLRNQSPLGKFPACRENSREFFGFGPIWRKAVSEITAFSVCCGQIP